MTDPMLFALSGLALLAWLYLVFLNGGFWRDGERLAPERLAPERRADGSLPLDATRAPPVAVVVPARDEAECIARSIGSLLAQDYPGPLRVILVDDGSSDGTADLARALPGAERLTVISGTPRPDGWAGKLWAVKQGLDQTSEPFVLLTDADIEHSPEHLRALVAKAQASGTDMTSEMVELNCQSFAERALVPAFVYLFAMLYPFARVNDPRSKVAAGAGGTVLLARRALERIGGIGAIRGALIDDVALSRAVKKGGPVWLGHSRLARSIRPYPHVGDIWAMIARSAYVQLRYSPVWLVATVIGMALVFIAPVATALAGAWMGLAAWALMAASFVPTLRRFRLSLAWAPALPAIACFYLAATIGSAVNHHRGRGVVWKRRAYTEKGA